MMYSQASLGQAFSKSRWPSTGCIVCSLRSRQLYYSNDTAGHQSDQVIKRSINVNNQTRFRWGLAKYPFAAANCRHLLLNHEHFIPLKAVLGSQAYSAVT